MLYSVVIYPAKGELPEHRLAELRRSFQDCKVFEGNEGDVGDLSEPQEAKAAIKPAISQYYEHFAQSDHPPGTKAD